MDEEPEPRDLLEDQAPSTKLVYKVLDYEERLTQGDIVEKSRLSPRTARYGLKQLQEIDAIKEDFHFPDARKKQYSLTEEYQNLFD